jgi:hypothetical protein
MSDTSKQTHTEHLEHLEIDSIEECFGAYDKTNLLCKKHCVIRIKCAIEQDQILRTEMFEEWAAAQDEPLKLQ